jgi:uncharacterized membrane protein
MALLAIPTSAAHQPQLSDLYLCVSVTVLQWRVKVLLALLTTQPQLVPKHHLEGCPALEWSWGITGSSPGLTRMCSGHGLANRWCAGSIGYLRPAVTKVCSVTDVVGYWLISINHSIRKEHEIFFHRLIVALYFTLMVITWTQNSEVRPSVQVWIPGLMGVSVVAETLAKSS